MVVQARSAFSTQKKMSILLEEGQRRLRNCSPELDWEGKVLFLNRFSSDLKRSGHSVSFRRIVLKRVIMKYRADLSNHLEGRKRMYRTREERQEQNQQGRACTRDTWFRTKGATSTLTVPATPKGTLANLVRENLERSRRPAGTLTKVIESGGTSAQFNLVKSNQFPRDKCHKPDCILCFQKDGDGKQSNCDKSNIGYEGQCARCPGRVAYIGETSKPAYTRFKQHYSNYKSAAAAKLSALPNLMTGCSDHRKDVKSWMWEHTRDVHGGVVGDNEGMSDYNVKVTGKFRKCLERQVTEGLLIEKCEKSGGKLLNSKNEYFTPKNVETIFKQW